MSQPKLYLLPGMGANRKMYAPLRETGLAFEVLEFIDPLPKESLPDYARRMLQLIPEGEAFYLGGTSLGGVIAVEMAKLRLPLGLILISSCKTSREFPFYFRLQRYLRLHRIFSGEFMRKHGPRSPRSKLPPDIAEILRSQREEANPKFIDWAIDAVIHWRSKELPQNVLHIHGTRDGLLPGAFVRGRIPIHGGRHVAAITHAGEVAKHITAFLGKQLVPD
ncbi:MAG: hypothetical protein U0176_01480 [Bacteroidia bacterium]